MRNPPFLLYLPLHWAKESRQMLPAPHALLVGLGSRQVFLVRLYLQDVRQILREREGGRGGLFTARPEPQR